MTRATKWLAVAFVVLSIVLAALAVRESGVSTVSTTLDRNVAPASGSNDLLADPTAPAAAPSAPADQPAADPLAE